MKLDCRAEADLRVHHDNNSGDKGKKSYTTWSYAADRETLSPSDSWQYESQSSGMFPRQVKILFAGNDI